MKHGQKHPTSNIQHPTSKVGGGREHWLFDVGCWLLDVSRFRLGFGILLAMLAGGSFASAQTNGNQTPGPADYAQFSRFVAERNIFDPNRQPHYTSSRTRTRTARTHSPSTPAFTLVGTMSYEKGLFAFFSGNSDELKQVLPVGQKIAGYTVTQIAPGRVTLAAADQKGNLQLRIGDVMRQENGKWALSGSGEVPAGDSPSTPEAASAPSSDSPESAATPAGEPNEILRKLMEKRAKESQ
jgi:hypothetical protein